MPVKLTYEELTDRQHRPEEASQIDRIPLVVVLENIRSLYNVGSIFRTSDAVAVQKLILTGFTGKPPRKEIDKTALGAVQTVPWEYAENTVEVLAELKKDGYQIAVLEQCHDSANIFHMKWQTPLVLVLGNEVFGVTEEATRTADIALEIPMFGVKQSLNVSVAYGVAAFALRNGYGGIP